MLVFVLALFFSFVFGIQHLVPLAVLHCAVALLGFASVTNGFAFFTSGFASKLFLCLLVPQIVFLCITAEELTLFLADELRTSDEQNYGTEKLS